MFKIHVRTTYTYTRVVSDTLEPNGIECSVIFWKCLDFGLGHCRIWYGFRVKNWKVTKWNCPFVYKVLVTTCMCINKCEWAFHHTSVNF